jgi:hypothetical protein
MHTITYIKNNIEFIIFFTIAIIFLLLIIRRNWEGFYNEQHGINRLDAIIYIDTNESYCNMKHNKLNSNNEEDDDKDDNDGKDGYDDNDGDNDGDNDDNDNNNNKTYTDLLMKELKKLNTNMNKVHKASKSTGVFIPKNDYNSCIQSHILALKMIKNNKWKRVLILDDNIELDMSPESFNNLLNDTFDTLDETQTKWDVILLTAANKEINNKIEPIPISSSSELQLQKIKSGSKSSAYIIKDSYVDNILDLFDNKNNKKHNQNDDKKIKKILEQDYNNEYFSLEQRWLEIQDKDNWFVINKDPIKQRS